ncbi:hypothetical protein MRX96_008913 [Rhipicephalus microplus]
MSKMKRDAAISGRASAAPCSSGRNKRCRRRGSNRTSRQVCWPRGFVDLGEQGSGGKHAWMGVAPLLRRRTRPTGRPHSPRCARPGTGLSSHNSGLPCARPPRASRFQISARSPSEQACA